MKSALLHLADTAPAWFSAIKANDDLLIGDARAPATPWAQDGLRLRIFDKQNPKVREDVPGTILPARCPERHIQSDKTFCLGLRPIKVQSAEAALQWWEQLRQFLTFQGTAELTRVWPPNHSLDHGDAGAYHERALNLAREAGLEEEYASLRQGHPTWLSQRHLSPCDRKGHPFNGRALCPRGCKRRARGRLVRTVRKDCGKRQILLDLMDAERLRVSALAKYWESVFRSGEKCCRTMRDCPLADHEDK